MRLISSLLGAAIAFAAPALAQTPAPPPASQPSPDAGRFSMTPTQGGFLRLDKETGVVSFCTVENGMSVCRVSADERAAFENEIEQLRRENAELKRAQAGAAPGGPSASPKEEEFERALSYTERFMRRMMRVFKEEADGGKP